MSVADKQMMVTEVKKILYDKVTSAELDIVSSALLDTLSYYDVLRVSYDNVTSDSNEVFLMFVEFIQFELFLIAVDCFWYGGFLGYDHIIWKRRKIEWLIQKI